MCSLTRSQKQHHVYIKCSNVIIHIHYTIALRSFLAINVCFFVCACLSTCLFDSFTHTLSLSPRFFLSSVFLFLFFYFRFVLLLSLSVHALWFLQCFFVVVVIVLFYFFLSVPLTTKEYIHSNTHSQGETHILMDTKCAVPVPERFQ